jgi:hypothetical protein
MDFRMHGATIKIIYVTGYQRFRRVFCPEDEGNRLLRNISN